MLLNRVTQVGYLVINGVSLYRNIFLRHCDNTPSFYYFESEVITQIVLTICTMQCYTQGQHSIYDDFHGFW